ncbi:MAG: LOG family protein [Chloroflexi bacterium]|nr:LOG family protein [Chloroflexota bacterium]
MKTITVFGGSLPKPGSPAYLEAQRLGTLLAEAGYAVQTGGYIGTMEAVSRGASEAGGHVIGVTCDEIESWRPVAPNQWVEQEKRCPTLRKRLDVLIDECDGAIALPGGIGTLTEIVLTWAQLQIQPSNKNPLILVGNGWGETLGTFKTELGEYIPAADQNRIISVPDVECAVVVLGNLLP